VPAESSKRRYALLKVNTAVKAGAEGVRWDLTLLAPSEHAMKVRLESAVTAAQSFSGRWPVEVACFQCGNGQPLRADAPHACLYVGVRKPWMGRCDRRWVAFRPLLVFAVVNLRSSLDHPLGDAIETFIRREAADHFIARVKRDDPQFASNLRVVERDSKSRREKLDPPSTVEAAERPAAAGLSRQASSGVDADQHGRTVAPAKLVKRAASAELGECGACPARRHVLRRCPGAPFQLEAGLGWRDLVRRRC
jgi:hypothetical protein